MPGARPRTPGHRERLGVDRRPPAPPPRRAPAAGPPSPAARSPGPRCARPARARGPRTRRRGRRCHRRPRPPGCPPAAPAASIRLSMPRALNEPVCCSSSSFSATGVPNGRESSTTDGVRRTRSPSRSAAASTSSRSITRRRPSPGSRTDPVLPGSRYAPSVRVGSARAASPGAGACPGQYGSASGRYEAAGVKPPVGYGSALGRAKLPVPYGSQSWVSGPASSSWGPRPAAGATVPAASTTRPTSRPDHDRAAEQRRAGPRLGLDQPEPERRQLQERGREHGAEQPAAPPVRAGAAEERGRRGLGQQGQPVVRDHRLQPQRDDQPGRRGQHDGADQRGRGGQRGPAAPGRGRGRRRAVAPEAGPGPRQPARARRPAPRAGRPPRASGQAQARRSGPPSAAASGRRTARAPPRTAPARRRGRRPRPAAGSRRRRRPAPGPARPRPRA